jgi:hypothetical protein
MTSLTEATSASISTANHFPTSGHGGGCSQKHRGFSHRFSFDFFPHHLSAKWRPRKRERYQGLRGIIEDDTSSD